MSDNKAARDLAGWLRVYEPQAENARRWCGRHPNIAAALAFRDPRTLLDHEWPVWITVQLAAEADDVREASLDAAIRLTPKSA